MSWNLVTDFGADPSGVADCTPAWNSAFSTIGGDAFGGELILPKGAYSQLGQATYSSAKPIKIRGEGQQASQIRMASTSTSLGYMCIEQGAAFGDEFGNRGTFEIESVGFYNDSYSGSFTNTNIALYLSGVNHGSARNVGIYRGAAGQRVNQGIVHNGCSQFDVTDCDIWAVVNAVAYEGYCQVCTVKDSHLWTKSNSTLVRPAAVLYLGQTLGAALRHVICHDGERGVYAVQDSNGQQPHLLEMYDVETNNHTTAHFEFAYGLHSTLAGCILSGNAVSINVPGILYGPNYQGEATVADTQLIDVSGHSMQIQGGTGYLIDHCKWGGSGSYKYAANAADELNIGSAAAMITMLGSHFNTEPQLGVGTSMPPRYAINSAVGISQAYNQFASGSLYGGGRAIA